MLKENGQAPFSFFMYNYMNIQYQILHNLFVAQPFYRVGQCSPECMKADH